MKSTSKLAWAVLLLSWAVYDGRGAIRCVDVNSTNPAVPFVSWATAANTIQDAIDVAAPGDTVLVADGVYQTGGRVVAGVTNLLAGFFRPITSGNLTNRIAVTKPIVVQSVNGPMVTVVECRAPPEYARCVFMTNGATLSGFTLRNGSADYGGGIWSTSTNAFVSNCIIVSNVGGVFGGGVCSATIERCHLTMNHATRAGGGAFASVLNSCVVMGNIASGGGGGSGGGASFSTLNNCTVVSNTASAVAGGADSSLLNNCVAYYNKWAFGSSAGSNYYDSILNYCCTTPLPTNGVGNITVEPGFLDLPAGDLRLGTNSPCINSGDNRYAGQDVDLDNHPRVVGGTVDIGAYEFQSPGSRLSYAFLQQYGLPTDGSADCVDSDDDGMKNWQEWRAGTNPTDAASALRLLTPVSVSNGVTVAWQSVANRIYYVQRSPIVATSSPFATLQSNIVGQEGMTSFVDTNAAGAGPFFYRAGVQ